MQHKVIGIEIGGTKLQLVLGTGAGVILDRRRLPVARGEGGEGIRRQIAAALPGFLEWRPAAIGVGFGGPVEQRTGAVRCSHQIEGWAEFPLQSWIGSLAGLPVRVDNDANVGALGEALHGAGRGHSPVFYCTLGSGVGGGLAVDGRIFHGATPGEVEFGHLWLDRRGTTVEARCSGWAVDSRIRKMCGDEPESLLARLTRGGKGGEARFLGEAVRAGDAAARRVMDELAGDLAFALSHVAHLLHPEMVVLGGGLGLLGEALSGPVGTALPGFVMEAFAPGPKVATAALGEDAIPVGALALAAQLVG